MPAERGSASTPPTRIGIRLAALATEQRGVVARRQLEALGYAGATISDLVARGHLCRVWPAVYAHGHAVLTRDGWLMAAALACGEEAQLAGRAAAAARGLLSPRSTIDVITAAQGGGELDGIRSHRVRLRPEERDAYRGLPVTSLARTALDVAAWEAPHRLGELLDRALLDGQYDHAEMLELMAARRGARGMARLRAAVALLGDEGTVFRSRPERVARDLLRDAGLSEPAVNGWFPTRAGHGYELDLWWAGPRVNVEVDGPHHLMPHQRRLDALRDRELRSFGVRVTRVRDVVVLDKPARFVALVADALAERG